MRYPEFSAQHTMLQLMFDQPLFVGFKADTALQRHLESLGETDKQYVSENRSALLRVCRMGEDVYVGKLIHEPLTTDQVDDIRRNVMSIMQKIRPTARCPNNLKILPCKATEDGLEEKCGP
jgi:hypothetical protein